MTWLWRWIGCLTLLTCLPACQPSTAKTPLSGDGVADAFEDVSGPFDAAAIPRMMAGEAALDAVDWTGARDCRGMLAILKSGLAEGRITDLHETPFSLVHDDPLATDGRWWSSSRAVDLTGGASSAVDQARCVLRIGEAAGQQSDHRIFGREQVRSRYQSGTRSEKNPAYEVAKTRLREAEKAAKPGKSSIIKVGDPLIDLVGMLVGGALTGIGQWGAGDQVQQALDELIATPQTVEHPKYRDYHFERARVRASREAVLSVILTDRVTERSWQASLKRRERRELFLVDGLERQDEHYARHRQNSLTEDGLKQWLAEPPSLPLADMVTVLLDRPETAPVDRLALGGRDDRSEVAAAPVDGSFMDAAALPPAKQVGNLSLSSIGVPASRITLVGEKTRVEGIYIASHFILTPSEVVNNRGLVDIEDRPGRRALGLVAAVDRSLGLALIHAPAPGKPVTFVRDGETHSAAGPDVSPLWKGRKGSLSAKPAGRNMSGPILIGDRLVGFTTAGGPDIGNEAIAIFLKQQRHLLPEES